ncbi:transglycosylase SLT domain-containing protein [Ancylobacter oerskovii]|uniref:Transglycosylase SLT domain-containing protein n=2 Tax=Ancylobacter oerskovii TaxID=459519 RepID=A0ABW4Z0A1_9HYPH|nr:lytic transglycosylase domain-containing protein [Ancylobacter oerskovii]
MPVVLLAPVVRDSSGLVASSYAGWLTDPPHGALPAGRFVVRAQAVSEVGVFQREIAVPPPAHPSGEAALSAAIPSPIPLPPKRLAERPVVVMASLVPLPPKRLAAPLPRTALAMAPPEEAMPEEPPLSGDAAGGEDVNAPAEDAAAPIDDAPEPVTGRLSSERAPPRIEALIVRYAERFDVPARLVRRVAWRESKFDPSRRHGPYWGLMQIRVDTARALGFRGAPKDLLDADTNMAYAAAYLANAYRVAGRDETRAVMLYARGYYYEAKRKGMLGSLIRTAAAEE